MTSTVIVIALVGVVALAIAFGPGALAAYRKNQREGECRELMRQLVAVRSQQGAGVQAARELESQVTACAAEGQLDARDVERIQCDAIRQQMNVEMGNLRSTDYSDILKRGNIRNSILGLGEDLARCFTAAIEAVPFDASGITLLRDLEFSLRGAYADSEARQRCFKNAEGGCDRYFGSLEPSGDEKARDEWQRVNRPLAAAYALLRDKEARVREASAIDASSGARGAGGRTYGEREDRSVVDIGGGVSGPSAPIATMPPPPRTPPTSGPGPASILGADFGLGLSLAGGA